MATGNMIYPATLDPCDCTRIDNHFHLTQTADAVKRCMDLGPEWIAAEIAPGYVFYGDQEDTESWALLPDGSVIDLDAQ